MALSVDWSTLVVTVPQADLTPLGGGVYELDLDAFRLELGAISASEEGQPFDAIHRHIAPYTMAGTTYARAVEVINGYTVEFEDGQYAVNLKGANSNVSDVQVVNQVSTRSFNTAGLVLSDYGPMTDEQALQLLEIFRRLNLDASRDLEVGPDRIRALPEIDIELTEGPPGTFTGKRQ